jgi:hypothetical protein
MVPPPGQTPASHPMVLHKLKRPPHSGPLVLHCRKSHSLNLTTLPLLLAVCRQLISLSLLYPFRKEAILFRLWKSFSEKALAAILAIVEEIRRTSTSHSQSMRLRKGSRRKIYYGRREWERWVWTRISEVRKYWMTFLEMMTQHMCPSLVILGRLHQFWEVSFQPSISFS